MKIESVIRKVVIVINGVEHIRGEEDWTESVLDGEKDGCIENDGDVFDWIEIN